MIVWDSLVSKSTIHGVAPLKLDAFPVLVFLCILLLSVCCLWFSSLCLPSGATLKWEYSEMQNLFSDYSDAKARSQKFALRVFQPEKDDICKEPLLILQLRPNLWVSGSVRFSF